MKLSDSQNYINNQQLVAKLLDFVDFDSVDTILEIGPGKGIITDALIRTNKEIISVEADQKLFLNYKRNTRMLIIFH
jgi:16S rRNA A1518/A1519 N6-dimethyltransferase RsmA/KsgA/DIM1 with predicted DNA glycosylase/AP lyase activity